MRTADCEAVDERSDVWESVVRWICLANLPRDVESMFRRALVGEVATVDLHSDKTIGLPFEPSRELKELYREDSTRTVVYLWPATPSNNCHIPISPSFGIYCEICHQDSLGIRIGDHSRESVLPQSGC